MFLDHCYLVRSPERQERARTRIISSAALGFMSPSVSSKKDRGVGDLPSGGEACVKGESVVVVRSSGEVFASTQSHSIPGGKG